MKTVYTFKASRVSSDDPVESTAIIIDKEIPPAKDLTEAFRRYEREAWMLANNLIRALPQGTLNRLTAELMGRAAAREGYKGAAEKPQTKEEKNNE